MTHRFGHTARVVQDSSTGCYNLLHRTVLKVDLFEV